MLYYDFFQECDTVPIASSDTMYVNVLSCISNLKTSQKEVG